MFFQPGEALAIYAVCGLLVLPFFKVNKHVNFVIGMTFLILFAVMGEKPLNISIDFIGLGIYRIFENLGEKIRLFFFTASMLIFSGFALYAQYQLVPNEPFFSMIVIDEEGPIDAAIIKE